MMLFGGEKLVCGRELDGKSGVKPPHSKGKVSAVIERRYKRSLAEN
jgi:hypothetical protein